jgi:hypothetical protein
VTKSSEHPSEAQLGPHTGYAAGVLGPLILAGLGMGMVILTAIATGTFAVAPQDAGVASATVTVGQQLGASIGTLLLNTIFAGAVTSYLAAHLAAASSAPGQLAATFSASRLCSLTICCDNARFFLCQSAAAAAVCAAAWVG